MNWCRSWAIFCHENFFLLILILSPGCVSLTQDQQWPGFTCWAYWQPQSGLKIIEMMKIILKTEETRGKMSFHGKEMSIQIISDKCSHFVCLPWGNGVILSNSEHYPVYLKTKNFARVGNKSMTKEGMCGGAIIDEKNILTAAHCTGDKQTDSITVYAGLVNIKKPFLWRRSENEQQFSPNPNPGFFRN